MSSDRNMVSSAADCRGKPQPIRSVGNSIRSHSEQRGCNMCTKGLSSSRGFSLAAAALAADETILVSLLIGSLLKKELLCSPTARQPHGWKISG